MVETMKALRRSALPVFCLAWTAAAWSVRALDPERRLTQYVLETWTSNQGAPSGAITTIAQTRDGYLWLGTEAEGLDRFDGISFQRTSDLDRLFDRRVDHISSLLCGSDGTLWVGTDSGLG